MLRYKFGSMSPILETKKRAIEFKHFAARCVINIGLSDFGALNKKITLVDATIWIIKVKSANVELTTSLYVMFWIIMNFQKIDISACHSFIFIAVVSIFLCFKTYKL